MVPAGALSRWEVTASESVHSMGMTWEVCDKTQPGNRSKTIQDHKTFFSDVVCIKVTQYHISYNACHTVIHVWAHFEALGNNNLNAHFVCGVFCFGFCYCCFGWAETDFVLYQSQIAEVSSSSNFFSWLYFFHPKDAVCDLQNGSFPQPPAPATEQPQHKAPLELELLKQRGHRHE